MNIMGNVFVRGNVYEDIPGSELMGSALIGVEFLDGQGMVINGPFFGVADAQGDYVIFIDPVNRPQDDLISAKVFFFRGTNVEKTSYLFLSYHGLDPQNIL